ncbi:MAG: nucleotidyltransferase domain-containing protein [Candidatus Aenigmarchaeota archaeon]|nr:nucleotidyltransferase domain-containing protein [Candidatus Aenigmarchaeota archaeon]
MFKGIGKTKKFLDSQSYIKAAYIFGSMAKKSAGPMSDIDFAFLLDNKMSKQERFRKRLVLINKISSLLKTDKIDVVIMNDSNYRLNFEIIRTGKLIKDNEPARVAAETGIMSVYYDRKFYDDRHDRILLKQIEKGGLL